LVELLQNDKTTKNLINLLNKPYLRKILVKVSLIHYSENYLQPLKNIQKEKIKTNR
jgi:hypothetical protein